MGLCHGGNVLGNHHHHCLRYAYLTTWWDMMMWTICDWSDNGAIFRILINLIEVKPTLTVRVWNRGHHEIICELSSHLWSLDDSARTFVWWVWKRGQCEIILEISFDRRFGGRWCQRPDRRNHRTGSAAPCFTILSNHDQRYNVLSLAVLCFTNGFKSLMI